MQIFTRNSPYERGKVGLLYLQGFDDDAAGMFANVDGIIQIQLGGLQECGGDRAIPRLKPI